MQDTNANTERMAALLRYDPDNAYDVLDRVLEQDEVHLYHAGAAVVLFQLVAYVPG